MENARGKDPVTPIADSRFPASDRRVSRSMDRARRSSLDRSKPRDMTIPPREGGTRWERIGFGILLVGGLSLTARILRLDGTEFWFDEAYTGLVSFLGLGDIWRQVRGEVSPPLYYVLIGGWAAIGGHSEFALRALSVCAGSLTALCAYAIGRSVSPSAGISAGLVVAFAPLHVHYSREARMYAMLVLLLTAAVGCLLRALAEPGPKRKAWWIGYSACSAAAIWTHYFAVLTLPAAALLAMGGQGRRARRELLWAHAGIALAVLPLLPWVRDQVRLPAVSWLEALYRAIPPALAIPRTLELFAPGALYPPYAQFQFGDPLWRPATYLLLGAVLSAGALSAIRGSPAERMLARTGLAYLLVPLGLMALLSAARPIYLLGRYDLVAFPGFILVAGVGIARMPPLGRAAVGIVGIALALHSLWPIYAKGEERACLVRAVARRVVPALEGGDVVIYTGYSVPEVGYALRLAGRAPAEMTLPRSSLQHPGWIEEKILADPPQLRREAALVATEAANKAGAHRVWLILDDRVPGPQEAVDALQALGYRALAKQDLLDGRPGRWRQPMYAIPFSRPSAAPF